MATKMFERGMYRIYLTSNVDPDWVILHVPLDDGGRVCIGLSGVPQPYLFKATWNGDLFYGEAICRKDTGPEIYLLWASELDDVTLTNLAACPMVLGQVVLIWQTEEDVSRPYPFTVRAVQKL
jgi:hypothetical protein